MVDDLKNFTKTIEGFEAMRSSDRIDFFAFFFIGILKQPSFSKSEIEVAFSTLRLIPYSNINGYLLGNSNKAKRKKKKIKFLKMLDGFHLVSTFEEELKAKIRVDEVEFLNFSISTDSLEWKPSDIPFLNSKIKKSADFFTKLYYLLYHLENSIRKFLTTRLPSILGPEWERVIITEAELTKAASIRHESNLSAMIQDRGDNILFYCMWDDYSKIFRKYPQTFANPKDCDEITAHLNSMAKIRNAIAHNTATIPKEYQDELTLFLKKYIRIMKTNGG